MLENRSIGLGPLPKEPEYQARQPEVTTRMMEVWNWLERQGLLIHNDEQVADWFNISSDGERYLDENQLPPLSNSTKVTNTPPASEGTFTRRTAELLDILIASPSDVAEERDVVERVILEWNASHLESMGMMLHPVRWESHAYPASGDRPQAILEGHLLLRVRRRLQSSGPPDKTIAEDCRRSSEKIEGPQLAGHIGGWTIPNSEYCRATTAKFSSSRLSAA